MYEARGEPKLRILIASPDSFAKLILNSPTYAVSTDTVVESKSRWEWPAMAFVLLGL